MTCCGRVTFHALCAASVAVLVSTVALARHSLRSGPDLWYSCADGWWRIGLRELSVDVTRMRSARPAGDVAARWIVTPGPARRAENPLPYHRPDHAWLLGVGDVWRDRTFDDRTGAPATVQQVVVPLAVPFALSLFLPAVALPRAWRWLVERRHRNQRGFPVVPAPR